MDKYGFGGLVRNLIKRARDDMRQTGRTTSMLERVQPNDLVVFHRPESAKWFERKAREAGKEVRTAVVSPENPSLLSEINPRGRQRIVLDHDWVEIYIEQYVQLACENIAILEREIETVNPPQYRGSWNNG